MRRLSTQPNGTATKSNKSSFLSSNPVMRRLNKIEEVDEVNSATYGGITVKVIYFLLFTVAGVILQLVLARFLAVGQSFEINIKGFTTSLFPAEAIALIVAVVLAIVFQLLAFFVKGSTPVTGALYCITQGYFISFLLFKVLKGYEYLGLLALAITLTIILVMALLYTKGIVRVTKKFKMVMMTLFITAISVSILMVIGAFIPFTQPLVQALTQNLGLSIGFTVLFIIIAALFLICDFDTIDHVVNDHLPKKYEWAAAFGLAFTVVWLYLKVLDLLLTIVGGNKK